MHPAAPDGYTPGQAVVVNPPRLEQPAQSADLDVDDSAGPQVERLASVLRRMNALVQADRGRQLGLESRMIDDVIVSQGLLDQQQVERIELLERGDVGQSVRGIGIDLERNRRIMFANLPDHVHIPPGLDLQLDAAVTFAQELIDAVEQGSMSGSIPRLTPERISPRVPPRSACSGFPWLRASASQQAISRPARAKALPLTRR